MILPRIAVGAPDECWIWSGAKNERGYGQFAVNGVRKYAHRASYELVNGPIPEGLVCCHRCDTPSCCNPAHIVAGTQKYNLMDMAAKGRANPHGRAGADHYATRFSADEIAEIRKRKGEKPLRQMASDYGVSFSTMQRIMSESDWGQRA